MTSPESGPGTKINSKLIPKNNVKCAKLMHPFYENTDDIIPRIFRIVGVSKKVVSIVVC